MRICSLVGALSDTSEIHQLTQQYSSVKTWIAMDGAVVGAWADMLFGSCQTTSISLGIFWQPLIVSQQAARFEGRCKFEWIGLSSTEARPAS